MLVLSYCGSFSYFGMHSPSLRREKRFLPTRLFLIGSGTAKHRYFKGWPEVHQLKIKLTTHFYNQKDPSFISIVDQLNCGSFKQQDALKGHTIYFLSRIPVSWL